MKLASWDILANMLIFLFWLVAWMPPGRHTFFNPYLGAIERASGKMLKAIRPAFFGLPERRTAIIVVFLLCIFRAVAFWSLATTANAAYVITFGISPAVANPHSLPSFLLFSFISFAFFVFKIWGISLLYVRTKGSARGGHPEETLYHFAMPLSRFKLKLRPAVLAIFGILLAVAQQHAGIPLFKTSWLGFSPLVSFLKVVLTTLTAWVDVLLVLRTTMLVLIIGSWVSTFSASFGLMRLCRDWIDFLVGPLRRYPIRIGMFDLTPLVFFFILHLAHGFLTNTLYASYFRLQ